MPKGKLKTVGNCRAVQILSGGPGLDLDSVVIKDKPDSGAEALGFSVLASGLASQHR